MRMYLAGPMRNRPRFNRAAFDDAAASLRSFGHTVFSPSEHDHEIWPFMYQWPGYEDGDISRCPEFDEKKVFRWDFARIMESDCVALLNGYEKSVGCTRERTLADWIGTPCYLAFDLSISSNPETWDVIPFTVEKPPSISYKLPDKQSAQNQSHSPLPSDSASRKVRPMARGFLDYFPAACAEIAHVSYVGNEQHNPGEPLHWAREKSKDHADCIVRHLVERGTVDTDGLKHSAKLAWRALALLQLECEGQP